MNATCRLLTIAAMLLHSIFGCHLHHACACQSHTHAEHSAGFAPVLAAVSCVHGCQHHSPASFADPVTRLGGSASGDQGNDGSACDGNVPTQHHHESPCCSVVQCSYISTAGLLRNFDFGTGLIVFFDVELSESRSSGKTVALGRLGRHARISASLAQCALHCSWQV